MPSFPYFAPDVSVWSCGSPCTGDCDRVSGQATLVLPTPSPLGRCGFSGGTVRGVFGAFGVLLLAFAILRAPACASETLIRAVTSKTCVMSAERGRRRRQRTAPTGRPCKTGHPKRSVGTGSHPTGDGAAERQPMKGGTFHAAKRSGARGRREQPSSAKPARRAQPEQESRGAGR